MSEPFSSFIPMLPRWRLPLVAPMHARRVQQRMSSSSSDGDHSLNRLREMQRSIMQRRSRLQEHSPKPPVVPRNDGQDLAEALFPNANPAVAEANKPGTDALQGKDTGEKTLGAMGVQQHVSSTSLDEPSGAVGAGLDTVINAEPEFAEGTGMMKHEWVAGEDRGIRDVKGSWRVTASTRSKGSQPVGLSSVLAQRDDVGDGQLSSTSRDAGPRDASPPSDATESVEQEMWRKSASERHESPPTDASESVEKQEVWRKSASKRPRGLSDEQIPGPVSAISSEDSAVRSKSSTDGFIVNEQGAVDEDKGHGTSSSSGNDLLEVVIVSRQSGSLPWKSAEKLQDAELSSRREEVVQLPDLSIFTSDPGWEHKDWKLPRPGQLRFDAVNSTKVDNLAAAPADCSFILDGLNEHQTQAVLVDPKKACLVLAGPGSGKTRVLTHRVAYLVKKYNVSPYQILAVTFTNKAAEEMKKRVSELLRIKFAPDWAQDGGPRLAMGTFHSISARILRKHGAEIGISPDFVICDTSDSRQVVSRLLKRAQGSAPDSASVSEASSAISKLKNDRDDELRKFWPRPVYQRAAELRALYDQELRSMNHLDFDDLLLETRKLLQSSPSVCDILQDTYEYVLVDEWQDTNHVQFDLVSLLSGRKQNLFVVGDADQSIYKFRGADSGNLERFTETFPNAMKIALEQNYRSSGCIVAAAQSVIEGNTTRPTKKMTTSNEFGSKITLRETFDDRQEAQFVVSTLNRLLRESSLRSYSDVAILYRTNAQSRLIEEACIQSDIPYRLLSGTKFYDRQEIRDLVAYLRVLSNPADDSAFRRIVNTPPRGIGKKTQDELEKFCESRRLSLVQGLDVLIKSYADGDISSGDVGLGKAGILKLADFQAKLNGLRLKSVRFLSDEDTSTTTESVDTLLTAVIENVGYKEYLEKREDRASGVSEKTMERLGNIEELTRAASRHTNLHRYLEGVTLMVDTMQKRDQGGEGTANDAAVSLMTLHGGKGLEFGAVFIIGVEDSVIPISRGGKEDIEEERRLFYVGMTRAKKHLYITWRMKKLVLQGGKAYTRESAGPSRFLEDIPDGLVQRIETSSSKWKRLNESDKKSPGRGGRKASGGRLTRGRGRKASTVEETTESMVRQWRAGDSVRCSNHGRGTVTIGAPGSSEGSWIEVMFADGSKHFVNTVAQDVELLYSPSS